MKGGAGAGNREPDDYGYTYALITGVFRLYKKRMAFINLGEFCRSIKRGFPYLKKGVSDNGQRQFKFS